MRNNSKTNAYKTAMTRIEPSIPMQHLATDGLIIGRAMDYGCGKGFDADYYGMEAYDPYFNFPMPSGLFDTITCNFVLNVIESNESRLSILQDIKDRLAAGGTAYITVRNDHRALKGINKTGSWQGLILLRLPVRYKYAGFVTYELTQCMEIEWSIQSALVN